MNILENMQRFAEYFSKKRCFFIRRLAEVSMQSCTYYFENAFETINLHGGMHKKQKGSSLLALFLVFLPA